MPELFLRQCHVPECANTIMCYFANCYACGKACCKEHDPCESHQCIGEEAAKLQRLSSVTELIRDNMDWFENELKILRPDHVGSITLPDDLKAFLEAARGSGFNYHFHISFEDGVEWLLRVRKNEWGRTFPEVTRQGVESEVSALQLLRENCMPVPEAFFPPSLLDTSQDANAPPLDYFYYTKIEGKPWRLPPWGLSGLDLPEDQLDHFIEEYATVQIRLSGISLPFTKIGCVYPLSQEPKQYEVGPIQTRGCFMKPEPPYLLGPFSTNKERYLAHIDAALYYITHNALQASLPGTRIIAVDEYLWHLELKELVSASKELDQVPDRVFFRHDDQKGDHLLVDEEQIVIGVLDWEWAYVTTKAEAFATPKLFYFRWAFLGGSNAMTREEEKLIACYERLGRPDLAECVRKGRLYSRLQRIGVYDPTFRLKGFREVFGDDIPADFTPPSADVDWRVYMMKRYKDHEGLRSVMKKFGWTLERAEEEAVNWHREQVEKAQKEAEKTLENEESAK
ncbi:hypothetical protein IAU59_004107 [Kwoniella sp. CBS 9459]